MNLPNKLTVARIIATPFFMLALLWEFPYHYAAALFLFIAASLTDLLDGKIARSRGLVTNFGKFLDPLADKMLTTAAFLGFIKIGFGTGITWIAFIVLFREFLIASLRLTVVSSGEAKVIAANIWGKLKTVTQMAAIIYVIALLLVSEIFELGSAYSVLKVIGDILLWASAVLCIISGGIYLYQNKEFVDPTK